METFESHEMRTGPRDTLLPNKSPLWKSDPGYPEGLLKGEGEEREGGGEEGQKRRVKGEGGLR